LNKFGIKHETSVLYTPQQNGKSERSMQKIIEATRTMLYSKKFSKNLWAEVVYTVVYVLSLMENLGHEGNTPYKILWYYGGPSPHNFFPESVGR
jgi:hypothetical protein